MHLEVSGGHHLNADPLFLGHPQNSLNVVVATPLVIHNQALDILARLEGFFDRL
jgi:hypothetical protein